MVHTAPPSPGRRRASEHEALREVKNEFMAQWEGLRNAGHGPGAPRVMVLGATNRPQDLDEAVLRRFNRRVFCPLPGRTQRLEILRVQTAGEALGDDVDLNRLAERTEGFSGSDLRQLVSTAAMRPVRELLQTHFGASQAAAAQPGASKAPPQVVDMVLAECEGMAGRSQAASTLRALRWEDFEAALLQVASTVGEDTPLMAELQQWNAQYGDGGGRGAYRHRLSYFM